MLFKASIDLIETPYFCERSQTVSFLFTLTVVEALAFVVEARNKPAAPTVLANNVFVVRFKLIHSYFFYFMILLTNSLIVIHLCCITVQKILQFKPLCNKMQIVAEISGFLNENFFKKIICVS